MVTKKLRAGSLAALACLFAPAYVVAQGPHYTIQDLGTLQGLAACNGTALSQSGNVVGYCTNRAGQNLLMSNPTTRLFLYSNGAMQDLYVTFPPTAFPTGVNDSGQVVGGGIALDLTDGTASAAPFISQNGTLQPTTGQIQGALPLAINNAGQIIATDIQVKADSLDFLISSRAYEGTVRTTFTPLTAPGLGATSAAFGISPDGEIAGATVAQNATQIQPLLWQDLTPQVLPLLAGYQQAIATAVNDSGVAAGIAFNVDFSQLVDPNAAAHAVLFNNGSITDLGVLPNDTTSMATGINNSGTVVGFSSTQRPDYTLHFAAYLSSPLIGYHAFVYSVGKMYDLTRQLVNGAGWQLVFATQINDAGQIVGTGFYQASDGTIVQHAFLLTPVPGPSIKNIVGAGFSTPAVTSISPNGLFTIFGSQLASTSRGLMQSDIVDNQLPTNLGGTCVESGSTKWGLFFVSPGQINVLAGDLPASGTVPVTVVTNCGTANETASAPINIPVASASPEFLYFLENSNGQNPVAAIEPNGAYVGTPGLISGGSFAPAQAGDVLTAFGVGWGPTSPSDTPGTIASGAAMLTSGYTLTLGGQPVQVAYAGLSPGYAGLYQINFTVPSGLSAGNQPLVLTVDGMSTSPTAYITVGN